MKHSRKIQYHLLTVLVILVAFGSGLAYADDSDHKVQSFLDNVDPNQRLKVSHVHGAGFVEESLIIATHIGLIRYREGNWEVVDSPPHDFMGFSITEKGAYMSGHPSVYLMETIPNPLGIMYSENLGKNLQARAYAGEIDFHWLSAGYSASSVFALTSSAPATNAPLFIASSDNGTTWEEKYLRGTRGAFIDIAAHPTLNNALFLLTSDGVYRSDDSGGWFRKITPVNDGVTLATSRNGENVYIGGNYLIRTDANGRSRSELTIPKLEPNDVILEIAAGPEGSGYLAYVTESLHVYLSKDNGVRWEKILTRGDASH